MADGLSTIQIPVQTWKSLYWKSSRTAKAGKCIWCSWHNPVVGGNTSRILQKFNTWMVHLTLIPMFIAVMIYSVSNAFNTLLMRNFISFSLPLTCFALPTMPILLTAVEIIRAQWLPSMPSEVTVTVPATDCPVPRQVAASDRHGLQSWLLINLWMPAWLSRLPELVCYHYIQSKCGISEKQSRITLVRPRNNLGTILISTSFFKWLESVIWWAMSYILTLERYELNWILRPPVSVLGTY